MATFAQLGVPSSIVDALAQRGIVEAFEIQAATIADSLAGRDILGRAPTGSGKTLAYGVPLIANVLQHGAAGPHRPSSLILSPTRELAEQIVTELETFAGNARLVSVYGGVSYGKQTNALRRGVDVLVACPGRLEDLIERRDVDLSDVEFVVIDEADRMADMGFMPSVKRLLDQTSPNRQTVLFSATLDRDVADLTRKYQNDPVTHEVGPETPNIQAATHLFWKTDHTQRVERTSAIINAAWPSVVFVRTRRGADRLATQLNKLGLVTVAIHGDMSQNKRQRALDSFSANRAHAMIATDVAARGIHVDGVQSVVHYDPPADHKDYVHRSGRTARAGESGYVISLVQSDQLKKTRRMIQEISLDSEIKQFDPDELVAIGTGDAKSLNDSPPPREQRVAERLANNGRTGGHRGKSNASRTGSSRTGSRRGYERSDARDDGRRASRNGQANRQANGPANRQDGDRRSPRGDNHGFARDDGRRGDRSDSRGTSSRTARPSYGRGERGGYGAGRSRNDHADSDRGREYAGRDSRGRDDRGRDNWERNDRAGRDDRGRADAGSGRRSGSQGTGGRAGGRSNGDGGGRSARSVAGRGPKASGRPRAAGGAGKSPSRLNRKARRAHLQPGYQASK